MSENITLNDFQFLINAENGDIMLALMSPEKNDEGNYKTLAHRVVTKEVITIVMHHMQRQGIGEYSMTGLLNATLKLEPNNNANGGNVDETVPPSL